MISMMITLILYSAAYYLQLNTSHYEKHIDSVDDINEYFQIGTHTLVTRKSDENMNIIKHSRPENNILYTINENVIK